MARSLLRRALARVRRPAVGVVAVLSGEPTAERRLLESIAAQRDVDVELVTIGSVAERVGAIEGLRASRVMVITDDVQPMPEALRGLAAAGGTVIGEMAGGRPAPVLLARMLVDRRALLSVLRDDDDRDGVLPALRLLRGEHSEIEDLVLSDVRRGERRTLWLSDPWADLDERLRVHRVGRGLARDQNGFDRAWLQREGSVLVESGEDATDEQWARFVEHVRELDLARLPIEQRAGLWIAVHRERGEVTRFVARRRFAKGFPTHVVDGQVVAELEPLPAELSVLTADEARLDALLTRLRRVGDQFELELFAGIRHVEQSDPATVGATVLVGVQEYPAEVSTDPAVSRWLGERFHGHDAGVLRVRVPATDGVLRVRLSVAGVEREGDVRSADQLGSASRSSVLADGRHLDVGWDRVTDGVTDVRVEGEELVVTGITDARLASDDVELTGVETSPREWRFPLAVDRWGLGERPPPSGRYELRSAGDPALASTELLDRLPEETQTPNARITVRVRGGAHVVVRLDPPLSDDEAGPRRQHLLQRAYAQVSDPLDPRLVYVQSFTGQAANDHPAAIVDELVRRRPDLDVRWLVADAHPAVPVGTSPVLHRSRDWYEVLARAGHIVTNIDLERWFRRRENQQVLQTYHGYPSKRMGIAQWRARGFPPSRIAQDLARSSSTWTALLTPQPDADDYYREQYDYDGRILAVGYPRDDVLVGPDAERIREEVRRRLGVGSRRVLLYAPTWRDDLATDFRRAEADHHLDVEELLAGLGPEWVVLLRGHRFHAAGRSEGQVLDLTSYPDVNDLILAADAAVLDYSSLRFDVALTGRPAVFLVPDLDRYTGTVRGFLQDFPTTAPGPLVATTAEVVAELRDYDRLVEATRDRIDSFNQRFSSLADGHAAERVVDAFFADLPPV